jgi:hypothetical protein
MTGYPWDSITNRLLKADDLNAAFATAYTNANQAITTANTAMAYVNTAVQYTLPVATPARLGGVKPDGLTLSLGGDGAMSVVYGTTAASAAAGNDARIQGALSAATAATTYAPIASPTFSGTVTAATTNVGAFTATGITASPISGSTGSFTTLAASSTVSGAGFSAYLASPPAIGGTVAAAGSFTTLSASSTVSGSGFSTYLASPPAIGGSSAAAGTFTTLAGTTGLSVGLTGSSGILINLYGAAGNNRLLQYNTAASLRWAHGANNVAESGANAGSAWELYAYSDAAGFLSTPISVARATGLVTMAQGAAITGGSLNNAPVGGSTASTGAFTTLSASSTVSGTGFSTYLASPPAIGGSAAAAGSFTTLSASSTVSGTGFTSRFASPGPIGNTSASTGAFTTISATSTITPSSTVGIVGTTTNDNAQAGSIGEVISATVASGSAVSLTSTTAANVTSISLTAGDWDVEGLCAFLPAGTTTLTLLSGGISTTTATIPGISGGGRFTLSFSGFAPGGSSQIFPTGRQRLSLSGTTTVYLVVQATFGTSTLGGYGYIVGRRVR